MAWKSLFKNIKHIFEKFVKLYQWLKKESTNYSKWLHNYFLNFIIICNNWKKTQFNLSLLFKKLCLTFNTK